MTKYAESQRRWRARHRKRVRYLNDRSATRRFIRNADDDDLHGVIEMSVKEQRARPNRIQAIAEAIIQTWPQYHYRDSDLKALIKMWLKHRPEKTIYNAIAYTKERFGTEDMSAEPLASLTDSITHPVMTDKILRKNETTESRNPDR